MLEEGKGQRFCREVRMRVLGTEGGADCRERFDTVRSMSCDENDGGWLRFPQVVWNRDAPETGPKEIGAGEATTMSIMSSG